MGLINWIKAVWNKLFKKEIEEKFDTKILLSNAMETYIDRFYHITTGHPMWEDIEDDIESINFAGYIDDVTAGLVTLDAKIELPDTVRGKMLQESADYVLQVLNDKVSEALGNAGLMFKPNGKNVDYIEPGNFAPTEVDSNGNILGCVFQQQIKRKDYTYTRLEWHRFEEIDGNREYRLSNYAYKSASDSGIGEPCELSEVPEWANFYEDIHIQGVKKPLYAYFKNPAPNRLDRTSPLGVPIWHNCIKELKDLDVAWGRKSGEIEDSKHITFLPETAIRWAEMKKEKLPRFLRALQTGNAEDNEVRELTATQVEADDQETIRTIKNIRDALQKCLEDLFYALNVMIDVDDRNEEIPAEDFNELIKNTTFDFGDILYNYSEDKAMWYQYVNQGYVPAYQYFTKFEGMAEDEAKKMVDEAKGENEAQEGLFGEE